MLKNVDEEESITARHNMTSATFLTEDGLYEVLMQSRKPIAKQFKKKVKEILKTIRKKGMYATDELLDNPDLIIKIATELKKRERREKTAPTLYTGEQT
jgi:anti-repressor protein